MISTKGFGNCIEDKKIILYIKNVPITSIEIFISFGKKKKFFNVRFSRNISLGDKPSIFKDCNKRNVKEILATSVLDVLKLKRMRHKRK